MDAFKTIGLFVGAAVVLGLGIFVSVVSIKKMASSFQPGTSSGGSRLWVFVRLILGVLVVSVGVALLIAGIVRVTS
jgi:uncharacterized membrane protein YidH (DUF202 family)